MKSPKNRILSALLCAAMLAAPLTGCGAGDTGNSTQTPSPTQSASPSGTASPTPEVRQKITAAIYDRGNIPASEGTITDNRWTRWINENSPVDVEFIAIPRWTSSEKYNALFASGTAPDLIEEFSVANLNTFYSNRLLMPLNDVVDNSSTEYKALLEQYPSLRKFLTREDGQMYTFGAIMSAASNHYLLMRKDWLDNLGLKAPTTPEEFIAVCDAFTNRDPDGNGAKDTLAASLAGTMTSLMTAMFGGMGSWQNDWRFDDSGEMVYRWDQVEASVTFKKALYDGGYIDKDFATDNNGTKAMQDFISGKLGIVGLNGGKGAILNTLNSLVENNPDADIIPIALPTTEFGSFVPAGGSFMQHTGGINASSKKPEAVIAYLDFLNKTETLVSLRYGGEEYSVVDANTGGLVAKNQEKFKTEVSYTGDFFMSSSKILDPYNDILPFNTNEPLQKRARDIVVAADKMYLDPSRGVYQLMVMPALPEELALIQANIGTQLDDCYTKAILGGSSYSAAQAVADARKIFTDAGGEQLTEYYNEWFKNNDSGIVSNEDMAKMLPEYVKN